MGAEESTLQEKGLEVEKVQNIRFNLQGQEHIANSEKVTPNTTLNHYLRNVLNMKGTKGMCFEGGCGACVVVLQNKDPITQKDIFLAVNSCLVPLLSCNDWSIYTIEGIGDSIEGYHPIQKVLAEFNGTQCGFCSPGMVMNMYALYESSKLTMDEVENAFSGNLCRCTGYRPILSAFKSLCHDATPEIIGRCPDIEDFVFCYNENCRKQCATKCTSSLKKNLYFEIGESRWYKVHSFQDVIRLLRANTNSTFKLVAGNTAQGVYKSYQNDVDLYIDISDVPELKSHEIQNNRCVLGANISLTTTIEYFNQVSAENENFSYLKKIAEHISLVANVPVRNRGTLAGNLIIKHDYHEFPSDIFLVLETLNAKLTIVNLLGKETEKTPLEFINLDMKKETVILKNIKLDALPNNSKYISYRIMPRAQNAHAFVNAGFLFTFTENNFINSATIVYGNINSDFVHASVTEKFLKGKQLFDNNTLKLAYTTLASEIHPNVIPPDPSPQYRQQLCISLFYKAVLNIAPPEKVLVKNKSGKDLIKRPISVGTQDYETNESLYPLTKPIPKLEALAQTSGAAPYIIDLPDLPFQLYAALVLANVPPNSILKNIDATKALKKKDVVAFFSKDDIPGKNSFTPISSLITSEEEIFCSGRVKYNGQPIGVLVGNVQQVVEEAVSLIEVSYDSPNVEPLLSIRQVLDKGRTDKILQSKKIEPTRTGNNVKHVIEGKFNINQQYHFHMETHCCQIVPNETGLYVYSSTQWMDLAQFAISEMLNIPQSQIHVIVRRCGGGFGAKISRANLIACVASLAAWKLKKPVKMWLPLTTNMTAIGKRMPCTTKYKIGVDDKGVIQYLNSTLYTDTGYQLVEDISTWIEKAFTTVYTSDTFKLDMKQVLTDLPVNTWARAPGSLEGSAAIETIIEHIAYKLKLDPLEVRLANLSNQTPSADYIKDITQWANITQRKAEIVAFNRENRWKKKGLAISPLYFDIIILGPHLVTVSIFHGDGSVQISHGGVEIGQGINTKAAQTCAYQLGIPIEKITVLPSNSFNSPNNLATGGSITSDGVCYGVIEACNQLLELIKPYRSSGDTWEQTINKCHTNFVKLTATGLYGPNKSDIKPYSVYGVCAVEVIVDILTGQHQVTRVDLIEDTGISPSPLIDIGQVEGAFVMGLGYHTTEKNVYNYEGKILTNNTWTYHVPGALDIPVNFNVKFPKNNPNPVGILKAKATGEPAICSAITIAFAIRNAVGFARNDADPSQETWFPIDGPTDIENTFLNSLNNPSQYVL